MYIDIIIYKILVSCLTCINSFNRVCPGAYLKTGIVEGSMYRSNWGDYLENGKLPLIK